MRHVKDDAHKVKIPILRKALSWSKTAQVSSRHSRPGDWNFSLTHNLHENPEARPYE